MSKSQNKPSLNSFKGYTYQQLIYAFFVAKMDIEREIESLCAEVICDHQFDDIILCLKDQSQICIQTKNYKNVKSLEIIADKVIINGNCNKTSQRNTNIFIIENYDIKVNSAILGLDALKEDNIYILSLSTDTICKLLESFYKDMPSRLNQILNIAYKKSTNENNYLSVEELPPHRFFSNDLLEKTVKIRNFKLQSAANTLLVIGKPGVGKSHLINELDIPQKILYRFWVSEQDPNKSERLKYDNFIKAISSELFGELKYHSVQEIIEKLVKLGFVLIVDGLDHVENYNKEDLQKYFNFFDMIDKWKDAKQIICTRPLKAKIPYDNIVELKNWDGDETATFLKEVHHIGDYSVFLEIYKKSNGYPIITDYLAKHYLLWDILPDLDDVTDIDTYYRKLISDLETEKLLTTFCLTRSYITTEEMSSIFSSFEHELIKTFKQSHPYLFETQLNRVALIHDSFNTFLIREVGIDESIKERFFNYVEKSINDFEIRFLSRIDSLDVPSNFVEDIIRKYSSFEIFEKLIRENIDYESIQEFYQKIQILLEKMDSSILTVYQYYDFVLILNILLRDNIGQQHELIFQYFSYLKKYGFDEKSVFSTKTIYSIYNYLYNGDSSIYLRYLQDKHYSTEQLISDLEHDFEKESCFFNILKEKITIESVERFEKDNILKPGTSELDKKAAFSQLLVMCYIGNVQYKEYFNIFIEFIKGNADQAIQKFAKIFERNGIREFMARWSLNAAFEKIHQLGFEEHSNDYLNLSLQSFVKKYAENGSFDLCEKITAYIRLANYTMREIDIESIHAYFTMYYCRKDSTALTLSETLYLFYTKQYLTLEQCVKCITHTIKMSEKGIRYILGDFLDLLDHSEIKTLENVFKSNLYDLVVINNLSKQTISNIEDRYVLEKLIKLLERSYQKNKVSYGDISNMLGSSHGEGILFFLKRNNFTIINVPKEIKLDFPRVEYIFKEVTEQDSKSSFDKGYLSDSEYELIKSRQIDHLTISKMLDGWYHALPYPQFYKMYPKEIVIEDICVILFNSIAAAKTHLGDNGLVDFMVGNIPLLLLLVEYDANWEVIYSSFSKFLEISQILLNKQ